MWSRSRCVESGARVWACRALRRITEAPFHWFGSLVRIALADCSLFECLRCGGPNAPSLPTRCQRSEKPPPSDRVAGRPSLVADRSNAQEVGGCSIRNKASRLWKRSSCVDVTHLGLQRGGQIKLNELVIWIAPSTVLPLLHALKCCDRCAEQAADASRPSFQHVAYSAQRDA
jgi:hypothetical protein